MQFICQACIWYNTGLKDKVDHTLEGPRACCAPPGSATEDVTHQNDLWPRLRKYTSFFSINLIYDTSCSRVFACPTCVNLKVVCLLYLKIISQSRLVGSRHTSPPPPPPRYSILATSTIVSSWSSRFMLISDRSHVDLSSSSWRILRLSLKWKPSIWLKVGWIFLHYTKHWFVKVDDFL